MCVCPTDINATNPKKKALFPVVLGHECAGVVESVGPGVTNFKPGISPSDFSELEVPSLPLPWEDSSQLTACAIVLSGLRLQSSPFPKEH